MKDYYRMIKRWDVIIIIILILFSFLPFTIFSIKQSGKTNTDSLKVAIITVDNQLVKEVVLTGHIGNETFEIAESDLDVNMIEVNDETIHIKSANCSDQICVRTKAISKVGQTIVCLPHKLVIEIQTVDAESYDEIIISS